MKSSKQITSRSNAEVQKLRGIRDGKDKTFFFCEGEKLIGDLLQSAVTPIHLYATNESEKRARGLLVKAGKTAVPMTVLSNSIMDFVSDMTTAPGLIVVAQRPPTVDQLTFNEKSLVLFLIGLQLPQNMGALLRTAEAAGVTDVLVSTGSCDPYNPKAVRGSAGSLFRLAVRTGLDIGATLARLKSQGVQIAAAHQNGKILYSRVSWTQPTALLVGAEGQGFEDPVLQQVDATVKIPMQGKVESLNAGVAAALCLYEAARRRLGWEKP